MGNWEVLGRLPRTGSGKRPVQSFMNSWANPQAHMIGPDSIQQTKNLEKLMKRYITACVSDWPLGGAYTS